MLEEELGFDEPARPVAVPDKPVKPNVIEPEVIPEASRIVPTTTNWSDAID